VVGREEHDHAVGHDVAHVEHQPAQLLDLVKIERRRGGGGGEEETNPISE
jgi:hypothetical protein